MDRRPAGRLVVGLCLLAAAGCRSEAPRGEVEGTVRCDGKPLPNVLVTFLPESGPDGNARRSSGVTDPQGRYRLSGEDQRAGAAAGRHRVIVEDLAVYSAPRDRDGTLLRKPPVRFPPRYSDPLQTPLHKEVQPGGPQTIDLGLSTGR